MRVPDQDASPGDERRPHFIEKMWEDAGGRTRLMWLVRAASVGMLLLGYLIMIFVIAG